MDDIIFRVGEGRTSTGKILDRDTKWFTEADKAGLEAFARILEKAI